MHKNTAKWFVKGLKDGIPIALGYFAVSFALGITAKNAGLTPLQATLTSMFVNASAGEYAGFTLIAAAASYLEMAIMIFVANARYLLMSCALSQKISPNTPLRHRLLLGFDLTDEIFGISMAFPGQLNPYYAYGAMLVAIPGWAGGTCLGVVMGSVLSVDLVSALSVGLYGMFLAIIIPPARKNKIVCGVVLFSMLASFLVSLTNLAQLLSDGTVIIILTVVISALAALLFPIKEDNQNA